MRKNHKMDLSRGGYSLVNLADQVHAFSKDLGGVFTHKDFFNLLPEVPRSTAKKAVARLVAEGIISMVKRGIYVTKDADLWVLAARLNPRGYISADSVLSKEALIGTIPARRVIIVSPLPRRVFKVPQGFVYSLQIKKELMFGYTTQAKGVQVADKEKAFLDLLYFSQRRMQFVASPYEDINLNKLDLSKLREYLRHYQDKKFTFFVKRIINVSHRENLS